MVRALFIEFFFVDCSYKFVRLGSWYASSSAWSSALRYYSKGVYRELLKERTKWYSAWELLFAWSSTWMSRRLALYHLGLKCTWLCCDIPCILKLSFRRLQEIKSFQLARAWKRTKKFVFFFFSFSCYGCACCCYCCLFVIGSSVNVLLV